MDEEQDLLAELKKIETRKREREKKTADLQKLITAAETPADQRKQEKKHHIGSGGYKKKHQIVSKRDSVVSYLAISAQVNLAMFIRSLNTCIPIFSEHRNELQVFV